MAKDQAGNLIEHLRSLALAGVQADRTDGQLLEDYISRRDEAAVAALVRRHGPMVWGVCRRVLGNHHDAEDAFQATFLVLVRKAASIVPREMVGNWLYGVARQAALKARATAAKRQARERQVKEMPEPAARPESESRHDLEPLLDQELSRLPDKYRAAIVLCDLEGKSRKEAARQLKIPEGTLSSRLTTARSMLAKRLARHGLALSGAALASVLSQNAALSCVPPSVMSSTIKLVSLFAAGQAAASGAVSATVSALTEGVLKTMLLSKLKIATAALLVVVGGLTVGEFLYRTQAADPPSNRESQDLPSKKKHTQPVEGPKSDKEPSGQAVEVSGEEIASTFEQNEARVDEKLLGKKLRVGGKVYKVERVTYRHEASESKKEPEQYYMLTFLDELLRKDMRQQPLPLAFLFPVSSRKQLAELKAGQQITIEGVCQGWKTREVVKNGMFHKCIAFTDCEIVEKE